MLTFALGLIRALHLVCVVYLVLGWLLPAQWLPYHLLAIPAVILHWWQNRGQCFLTQIEHRLSPQTPADEVQGEFTNQLLAQLGWQLSGGQLKRLIYLVMLTSWLISLLRYLQ